MNQLVSPGVNVTITDESQYASSGTGTVPLIIIATEQDKRDPTNTTTIAEYTTKAKANQIRLVTSQRELTQLYGNPRFTNSDGSARIEGSSLNEYGLLATYSYLGQGSRAYVVRADVDLGQLEPIGGARTTLQLPIPTGSYWINTARSNWGIRVYNANAQWERNDSPTVAENVAGMTADEILDDAHGGTVPADSIGIIVTKNATAITFSYYQNISGTWTALGTGTTPSLTISATRPTSPAAGNIWIKLHALAFNVSVKSGDRLGADTFTPVENILSAGTATVDAATNSVNIVTDESSSNLYFSSSEPTLPGTSEGTFYYNADLGGEGLQIYRRGAAGWADDAHAAVTTYTATASRSPSGSNEVIYSSTRPTDLSEVIVGDVWVDTSVGINDPNYPKIHVATAEDALPAEARDNSNRTGDGTSVFFQNGIGELSATEAAPGDILIDMGSENTKGVVQVYRNGAWGSYITKVDTDQQSYVPHTAFGRQAQHMAVAQAMQGAVAGNEELRDPARNFTLLCAPGFPELTDELVTLNTDRGETGFIIIDTPMRKSPNEAINWIQGNNASENGEDGLVTKNTYSAAYYPPGRSTTPSGETVTVPASHMALYTYAYNDSVAYPWFAPAGLTRGVVRNASAVGYVDPNGDFRPVTLNQGQRDSMYTYNLNPIANFPTEGVLLFGQKSLHPTTSALDRVNVARLVAYLRERFDEIARPLLFEQNDPLTQARAVQLFSGFLSDLIAKRALDDFAVECSASNNLPARVQRNELWVDIAVLPTKSIEFVYIPIRIVNAVI